MPVHGGKCSSSANLCTLLHVHITDVRESPDQPDDPDPPERQVLLDGSLSSCARSDPCERMTILTGSLSCIPGVCSDGA